MKSLRRRLSARSLRAAEPASDPPPAPARARERRNSAPPPLVTRLGDDLLVCRVHLLDNSYKGLRVASTITAQDLAAEMARQLGLQHSACFCVCAESADGVCTPLDPATRLAEMSDNSGDVQRLVYKRHWWFDSPALRDEEMAAEDEQGAAHRLAYVDAVAYWERGLYAVPAEQSVVMGGLLLQGKHGDAGSQGAAFCAEALPHLAPAGSEDRVWAQWQALRGRSKLASQRMLLTLVRFWAPLAESLFVPLSSLSVAVGAMGVSVFSDPAAPAASYRWSAIRGAELLPDGMSVELAIHGEEEEEEEPLELVALALSPVLHTVLSAHVAKAANLRIRDAAAQRAAAESDPVAAVEAANRRKARGWDSFLASQQALFAQTGRKTPRSLRLQLRVRDAEAALQAEQESRRRAEELLEASQQSAGAQRVVRGAEDDTVSAFLSQTSLRSSSAPAPALGAIVGSLSDSDSDGVGEGVEGDGEGAVEIDPDDL